MAPAAQRDHGRGAALSADIGLAVAPARSASIQNGMTESKLAISFDRERIAEFCRRWKIVELALFGSVLRQDFRPDSDVDVLVTFAPDARWSLFDAAAMEEELELVFGRRVDLVTRRAVESSHNWIRKQAILEAAQPVYVAG